jgi:PhnB protein
MMAAEKEDSPMSKVNHKPEGFHTVTPYLMTQGAERLLDFMKQAFGAEARGCTRRPDGAIMHAEVRIGDSILELSEATDTWKAMPSALHIYVEDVDATYRRALEAGATSLYEPGDKPYGDRDSGVKDPAGNSWFIATHQEDVSEEEMERRMAAAKG